MSRVNAAFASLSRSERVYIRQGAELDVRNDGRQRMDYRKFTVETGVIPHANGSARLRLDQTHILVAVKLDVVEPLPDKPNLGRVQCSVDCAASASISFEGYGAQDLNSQLSGLLQRTIGDSDTLDLESLCIIPGQQVWMAYIDAMVLDSSGNLIDSIALAAKAALSDTAVPAVNVVTTEEGDAEIEISDDPYDSKPFLHSRVPLCVSLCKIGSCFVVDPTIEEELCLAARITVAVNAQGQLCGTEKSGPGGVSPSGLYEMLRCAKPVAAELFQQLDAQLAATDTIAHEEKGEKGGK